MRARRRPFVRIACSLVVAGLLGPSGSAQELGRLFSTAQERGRLDALRTSGKHRAPPDSETGQEVTPAASRLTVNGLVMRERGPDSVWINGERVSRGEKTREGIRVHGEAGARVRVILPHDAGTVRLKAGQKIDLATGAVRDAYEEEPATPTASVPTPGAGTDELGP